MTSYRHPVGAIWSSRRRLNRRSSAVRSAAPRDSRQRTWMMGFGSRTKNPAAATTTTAPSTHAALTMAQVRRDIRAMIRHGPVTLKSMRRWSHTWIDEAFRTGAPGGVAVCGASPRAISRRCRGRGDPDPAVRPVRLGRTPVPVPAFSSLVRRPPHSGAWLCRPRATNPGVPPRARSTRSFSPPAPPILGQQRPQFLRIRPMLPSRAPAALQAFSRSRSCALPAGQPVRLVHP